MRYVFLEHPYWQFDRMKKRKVLEGLRVQQLRIIWLSTAYNMLGTLFWEHPYCKALYFENTRTDSLTEWKVEGVRRAVSATAIKTVAYNNWGSCIENGHISRSTTSYIWLIKHGALNMGRWERPWEFNNYKMTVTKVVNSLSQLRHLYWECSLWLVDWSGTGKEVQATWDHQ